MNFQLVSAILRGVWAIDSETSHSYYPALASIFSESGLSLEFDFNETDFLAQSFNPVSSQYSGYNGWNDAPQGSIAVIPVSGPLMKNDQYCGPIGMSTIGSIIKEADASPNISGIILKIDSPGGTVDGTSALADIIKATDKPIISFVDGLMASAALWIGSSADEVIASNPRAQIGSVGVILSFMDIQPAFEKLGVKFHDIVADQSEDKIKQWNELKEGNYDEYKKNVLNPLAADFIETVQANRPKVTDDQLTGKVFFAADVLGTLVDSIGDIDFALQRMAELTKDTQSTHSNNHPQMELTAIANVIGELETTEEGAFLNSEQLNDIEEALNENQPDADASTDLQEQLDTATARIAELESEAGAATAVVISEKETQVKVDPDPNVAKDKNSFSENLDALGEAYL